MLINKHEQMPEQTQLVHGDVSNCEIEDYIRSHERKKFLCTYDSASRLKNILGEDWAGYHHVADEFHCILNDSSFKTYTEIRFIDVLKSAPMQTWMSATPCLDHFLERIPHLKDLPYFQLNWTDREKVDINRIVCAKPVDACAKIVHDYKQGIFPKIVNEDGSLECVSKEAVFFLNSVTNIVNIIQYCKLRHEDCNIIVSNNDKNKEMISQLGEGFEIGKSPLKGEPHKRFTFCTSTAYMGVDFYSTNATTFVISDCKRINTSVDIATELTQIVGRQRLKENPFRKCIFFIYNSWDGDKDIDDRISMINEKIRATKEQINLFNGLSESLKKIMKRENEVVKRVAKDNISYTYFNESSQQFEQNELSVVSDEYQAMVQYSIYHDGAYVFKNLKEEDSFNTSESASYMTVNRHVRSLITMTSFAERMEEYLKMKTEENTKFNTLLTDMERKYPDLLTYFNVLGADRIRALGCKEKDLQNELYIRKNEKAIVDTLIKSYPVGTIKSASEWKTDLNRIFSSLGMKKKGKTTDLEKYGFKLKKHHPKGEGGTRYYVYEIIETPEIINLLNYKIQNYVFINK